MTEIQKLEKKIAKGSKIVIWLFIGLMTLLAGEFIWLTYMAYQVVHLK